MAMMLFCRIMQALNWSVGHLCRSVKRQRADGAAKRERPCPAPCRPAHAAEAARVWCPNPPRAAGVSPSPASPAAQALHAAVARRAGDAVLNASAADARVLTTTATDLRARVAQEEAATASASAASSAAHARTSMSTSTSPSTRTMTSLIAPASARRPSLDTVTCWVAMASADLQAILPRPVVRCSAMAALSGALGMLCSAQIRPRVSAPTVMESARLRGSAAVIRANPRRPATATDPAHRSSISRTSDSPSPATLPPMGKCLCQRRIPRREIPRREPCGRRIDRQSLSQTGSAAPAGPAAHQHLTLFTDQRCKRHSCELIDTNDL